MIDQGKLFSFSLFCLTNAEISVIEMIGLTGEGKDLQRGVEIDAQRSGQVDQRVSIIFQHILCAIITLN
jgi:hypothetical protein